MKEVRFKISRRDGRSNQQVVLDYVRGSKPGAIFTYENISLALEAGTDRRYGVRDVQQSVRTVSHRLSKEHQRALRTVKGVGYRLAHASEHVELALTHSRKSEVQLRRGFELMANFRDDELTAPQRTLHEGHLMIAGALYQNQRLMWKKQNAIEKALQGLTARVDAISPE